MYAANCKQQIAHHWIIMFQQHKSQFSTGAKCVDLITNVKIPQKRGKLFFKQIFTCAVDSWMPQTTEMLQPGAVIIIAVPFFFWDMKIWTSHDITILCLFIDLHWSLPHFRVVKWKQKRSKLKRNGTTNDSGFCSLTIEMQIFGNGCHYRIFWKN